MLEQAYRIVSPIEPDRGRVAARTEALRAARGLEEIQDVGRIVREPVAEVLVAAGAIHEDTSVGADATRRNGHGAAADDLDCQWLERDLELVFLPGPCCGNRQARWPVVQVGGAGVAPIRAMWPSPR